MVGYYHQNHKMHHRDQDHHWDDDYQVKVGWSHGAELTRCIVTPLQTAHFSSSQFSSSSSSSSPSQTITILLLIIIILIDISILILGLDSHLHQSLYHHICPESLRYKLPICPHRIIIIINIIIILLIIALLCDPPGWAQRARGGSTNADISMQCTSVISEV